MDDLTCDTEESQISDTDPSVQESMNVENVISGETSLPEDATMDCDLSEARDLSEAIDVHKFELNDATESMLASSLKDATEFKTWDIRKLRSVLTSKPEMLSLTHRQLNRLRDSLKLISEGVPLICKSWKKEKKVSVLFGFINNVESVEGLVTKRRRVRSPQSLSKLCLKTIQSRKVPNAVLNAAYASYIYPEEHQKWLEKVSLKSDTKRRRVRSPQSLSKLCLKTIQSRKVPNAVLNAAYASYIYPEEHQKWLEKVSLKSDIAIKGHESDIQYWYSFPDMNCVTHKFIGNSIDCSHNFTHLRVRSCTTGIGDASPAAWKAVAESNETHLNIALVEDLLDKPSVPNTRTFFSREVENWMTGNGHTDAANVTNIIRSWYEAPDTPGISAKQRINDLIRMRNFLLKNVNFGKFPPPGRYINKVPTVTYEGILVDIDTKLQMYAITGPYNIRSVGSLAAETKVGVLQEMNPTTGVSIKARDVPSLISSVVEVMTCKINPDR